MEDKETKITYDYTHVIPVECPKCKHKHDVTKRVYSKKTLLNDPVKAEWDIQHFVEEATTLEDFNEKKKEPGEGEDDDLGEPEKPKEESDVIGKAIQKEKEKVKE